MNQFFLSQIRRKQLREQNNSQKEASFKTKNTLIQDHRWRSLLCLVKQMTINDTVLMAKIWHKSHQAVFFPVYSKEESVPFHFHLLGAACILGYWSVLLSSSNASDRQSPILVVSVALWPVIGQERVPTFNDWCNYIGLIHIIHNNPPISRIQSSWIEPSWIESS
jgi:hypothetical protein